MSLLKNSYFTRASQKENCWPSTADSLSSLLKRILTYILYLSIYLQIEIALKLNVFLNKKISEKFFISLIKMSLLKNSYFT